MCNLYNSTVFNSLYMYLTFPCVIFSRPTSNLVILFTALTLNFASALRFSSHKTAARGKYKVTKSFSAQCYLSIHLHFFILLSNGRDSFTHSKQINLKQDLVWNLNPLRQEDKIFLVFVNPSWQCLCYFKNPFVRSLYKHNSFQRRIIQRKQ